MKHIKIKTRPHGSDVIFSQKIELVTDAKGLDITGKLTEGNMLNILDVDLPITVNKKDIYHFNEQAGTVAYSAVFGGVDAKYF